MYIFNFVKSDDTKNYKKWAITQKIKAIERLLNIKFSQSRKEELDALRKDLDGKLHRKSRP